MDIKQKIIELQSAKGKLELLESETHAKIVKINAQIRSLRSAQAAFEERVQELDLNSAELLEDISKNLK